MRIYVGIDNGTSGAIGILSNDLSIAKWFPTPVKIELSYTKEKQNISRVDFPKLRTLLETEILKYQDSTFVVRLERPRVNPGQFKTTMSAMRSLEATIICLEELGLPFDYLDSKIWQKQLLPHGLTGKELKDGSKQIGKRLFPMIDFGKSDCDAILIAEWMRRNNL